MKRAVRGLSAMLPLRCFPIGESNMLQSKFALSLAAILGFVVGAPLLVIASILCSDLFKTDYRTTAWIVLAIFMSFTVLVAMGIKRIPKKLRICIFTAWLATVWCSFMFWQFVEAAAREPVFDAQFLHKLNPFWQAQPDELDSPDCGAQ
jgi:hypothetical protein